MKLWTCQGVARLSKLIDTPEAWELFTELEKNYFESAPDLPEPIKLLPEKVAPLDSERARLLVDLIGVLEPSPFKEQLAREVANSLFDKIIF